MGLAPLKVMCSNVTALQTNGSALLKVAGDSGVDVVFVQETKTTEATQKQLTSAYRDLGWQVVWGKALPPWRSVDEAKPGGVAILVKMGIPILPHTPSSDLEKSLWNSTRWVRTKVAYGNGSEWLDVTSVYAPVAEPEAREQLLSEVFEAATVLGDAPGIIAGDFNTQPADSGVLEAALATGWWKDTAGEHADVLGREPEATYVTVDKGKEISEPSSLLRTHRSGGSRRDRHPEAQAGVGQPRR